MWSEVGRFPEKALFEKPRQKPQNALWHFGTFAVAISPCAPLRGAA